MHTNDTAQIPVSSGGEIKMNEVIIADSLKAIVGRQDNGPFPIAKEKSKFIIGLTSYSRLGGMTKQVLHPQV